MSEVDNFFNGLPSNQVTKANIFEEPEETLGKEDKGDEGEGRKNRRERRQDIRDKQKDDMIVALNDRIIELSKPQNSTQTTSDNVPAEWIALYGDTPEAKKAWDVNKILIDRAKSEARDEAVKELEGRRTAELEEQKKFENQIDSELETLEDEFNIDLTSDSPAARKTRREFLGLVQNLSPKDDDGTILSYADFGETFKMYQKTKETKGSETLDRQKEIASRSMAKGNSGAGDLPVHDGPITFETARKHIAQALKS